MCTVSYVPLGAGNFILTSNRDENPARATLEPGNVTTLVQSAAIICPKDSKAGGTWIAMSTSGKVACLLNGAFIKHQHNPPYSKSRGLVLLDYFNYADAGDFNAQVDLNGIENFTLLLVEKQGVFELRWDGKQKYFSLLGDVQPRIWSSCTLYNQEEVEKKEDKFNNWMNRQDGTTVDELAFFHGYKNPEGFLLELPMVKTVSITSVQKTDQEIRMVYRDLLTNQQVEKIINLA
jgi:hypothetical protein